MFAPSAGNLQSWEFIVVRDGGAKGQIADACHGQDFIADAPVVVIVCANGERSGSKYGSRGERFYSIADACIAGAYLQLAAADMGLGTVWVGAFNEERIRGILGIPNHITPIGVFPIGHPAEEGHRKERLPLEKVLHMEKW